MSTTSIDVDISCRSQLPLGIYTDKVIAASVVGDLGVYTDSDVSRSRCDDRLCPISYAASAEDEEQSECANKLTERIKKLIPETRCCCKPKKSDL